jgi:endonuclease/exonuclease/phosphatase family metal-dependent hydrolase
MSYNIHHANPPSRVGFIDLEAIAGVINKENPDLVAIQEVDVHTGRSGRQVSEAEELASKTGLKAYFAKSIDYDGGDYGVLILSRYPMANEHTYRLPTASGTKGEPRVLATAEIKLPGRSILFACTHLDAQRQDSSRYLQINALTDILKKEKLPVVIGGDFNAEPNSRVIQVLDQFLTRTCVEHCGFTIPSDQPTKTIDFIAYTSKAFQVQDHQAIQEAYASDHLPVMATLHLQTSNK